MRWAVAVSTRQMSPTADAQDFGERILIDEARRHNFVIVGPVAVKVEADRVTDGHVLHAEADIITRRMPARGRK